MANLLTKLAQTAVVVGLATLAYQHWFSAKPLESHYLASIPVKVNMLPGPRTNTENTGQISLESAINQKFADDELVLSVMTLSTRFDTFDQEDIAQMPFLDYQEIGDQLSGLKAGADSAVIKRGFIEQDGQRGYEIVLNLGKNQGEMVQHIFTYENHMLVLMARYNASARDKKTAQAFLQSVDFL